VSAATADTLISPVVAVRLTATVSTATLEQVG
jgi:hypothetical protein